MIGLIGGTGTYDPKLLKKAKKKKLSGKKIQRKRKV